jgi:hypothetical protein
VVTVQGADLMTAADAIQLFFVMFIAGAALGIFGAVLT